MLIKAKVKTNQSKFSINKVDDILEIHTKSPPEKNKANREIIKELTKIYGKCKIVRGLKSSIKLLDVSPKQNQEQA